MSNSKTVNKNEEPKKAVEETPEIDAKDVIETLKTQLQEHQRQSEYHSTMALKAQGALEVLVQLHPQDNNENK